jgi:hypothetical protein
MDILEVIRAVAKYRHFEIRKVNRDDRQAVLD